MLDYAELQKNYCGQFVAVLNDNKVVAHGRTFTEVMAMLQKSGMDRDVGISIKIKHIQSKKNK